MFKVRDLLILAAVVLGVLCGVFRTTIDARLRSAMPGVYYYVDAPAREAEAKSAHEQATAAFKQHSAELEQKAAQLAAHVRILETQLSHKDQLLEQATRVIEQQSGDIGFRDGEIQSLRIRYAGLCQKLREMGSEDPAVATK